MFGDVTIFDLMQSPGDTVLFVSSCPVLNAPPGATAGSQSEAAEWCARRARRVLANYPSATLVVVADLAIDPDSVVLTVGLRDLQPQEMRLQKSEWPQARVIGLIEELASQQSVPEASPFIILSQAVH